MSEQEKLASFTISTGDMQKLLRWTSAPFDETYDKAWLNIAENEVRGVANAGEAVISYCDFSETFIRNIWLHDEADGQAGIQSILRVPEVQEYLSFVGGEELEVELHGIPTEEMRAEKLVLDGDIRVEIYIPCSDSDYESMQLGIVNTYDDDNRWIKPSSEEALATNFTTDVDEFNRIVDVVSFDSFALANYPVVIEDGEFILDASDKDGRDSIYGSLYAEDVEGPDVDNTYSRSFEELFSNISGEIEIGIEQDAPISIVRESSDESITLRYCILPAA